MINYWLIPSGLGFAVLLAWLVIAALPGDDAQLHTAPHVLHEQLPQQSSLAELERGRSYYVQICQSCHGAFGDGRGEWSYRMVPRPSDLSSSAVQAKSDEQLQHIIRNGIPGTAMRGWESSLNAAQQRQVVAYIRYLAHGANS